MSDDYPVFCAKCSHPFDDHDSYGCKKWLAEWEMGSICPCGLTRRQLLQLDEVSS